MAADPQTGAFLVFHGRVVQYDGTSWSAPVWAAICARLNAVRVGQGKAPLPFLNPLLYQPAVRAGFRDIVSGANGYYECGPGYDQVTGLGVPNGAALMAALA